MKSTVISRLLLGLVTAFILSSVASAEILKIVVNDTIQPITEEYIARAIDEATRRNDQAILIEINTPGGLVEAMAPGTNAGAAHPVLIGPFAPKIDDEMKRKIENDTAALMRSVAAKRGRNVDVAVSAVLESKAFTEQEALSQHLIDYVASSEEDLFRQMAGKTFKHFNGQPATLALSGQPIVP